MIPSINTVVFSVIFPANIEYFNDFIYSLNSQTCKAFDLLLINDGVNQDVLEKYTQLLDVKYSVFDVNGLSSVQNRMVGLELVRQLGYENIIFADTDDVMSFERVSESVSALKKYPIVFNDLSLISDKGITFCDNYWDERLKKTPLINKDFLYDKNVLGLGNTAIKSFLIDRFQKSESIDVIAFDWYFFSKIIRGDKACYVSNCVTYYRQHDNNCIGLKELTKERVHFILDVKEKHYFSLLKDNAILKRYISSINKLRRQDIDQYLPLLKQIVGNLNQYWWEETIYL